MLMTCAYKLNDGVNRENMWNIELKIEVVRVLFDPTVFIISHYTMIVISNIDQCKQYDSVIHIHDKRVWFVNGEFLIYDFVYDRIVQCYFCK